MKSLCTALALLVAVADARADEPEVARVVQALAVRHDPPSCATLITSLHDPAGTLTTIVDTVTLPPWVAVRAARCAVGVEAADAAVHRWLRDPEKPGLTEVVVDALPTVPTVRAVALADAALHGPHAERARRRLAVSPTVELRAIAVRP
jgi:hypothetical protein